MPIDRKSDPWSDINGGIRGSILLRSGAVVIFLAAMLNFFSRLLTTATAQSFLVEPAWVAWILGLWVLASGFFWVGVQPILTRMGIVVGLFFFLNGLLPLVILFMSVTPLIPLTALSMGRAFLLLVFAILEREQVGTRTTTLLVLSAGLLLVKITLRLTGLLPALGNPVDPALDALLVILMATAIFSLGTAVRTMENVWALEMASNRGSSFADFNNPEHERNKDLGL